MLIIGIDPGISGSICFLDNGKIIKAVEMPTMTDGKKNKKQVNGSQIFNEISWNMYPKNHAFQHISAFKITSIFDAILNLNYLHF